VGELNVQPPKHSTAADGFIDYLILPHLFYEFGHADMLMLENLS